MKINFIWIILIVLIISKFIGLINISWLWVFSPIWLPIIVILGGIILIIFILLLFILIDAKWEKY